MLLRPQGSSCSQTAIDAARIQRERNLESAAQHGVPRTTSSSACPWRPWASQTRPRPLDPPFAERPTCRKRYKRWAAQRGPSYASSPTAGHASGLQHHPSRRRSPTVTARDSNGLESDTTRATPTADIDRTLCQFERCERQLKIRQLWRDASERLCIIIPEWLRVLNSTRTHPGHRSHLSYITRRE